ncbi:hypothetical protein LMG31884_47240 (plasmid) [Xanthomonas hydrangeae]|uniref:hypothetical protein n=1 Tax=Xanthomonas hydrangeae TaxID=2775159 RepID=UPI001963C9A1|nr:hypothetical protein LMG31884_47240 [Xanthomonas hydrangeae]CAD7741071.1 hypothetical protein LMG31884_47240 [Xanthomonas hydrangeae]CAD7747972.1 hypothetical protein LMG31887_46570 [Xanthomonas hydrangeae]CAD7747973.1 hypothetical protein LMG31887_46570 [Xanthomonas hydrangeae]CAD7748150.1 hypothetical protein LMG31885_44920 [Xanthomonas hydrangeae]
MTDQQIIDEALDAFINATNTNTAGGGPQGYQHMLEIFASTMANDHGSVVVVRVLEAIVKQHSAQLEK